MRSLFFKIFIIFWIAQTLIFVITTAVILGRRFPHPASMLDPAFTSLHMEASQAVKAFDSNGCAGFQSFAQGHPESSLALVDQAGKRICGEPVPDLGAQLLSATEIYGRQVGQDTVWTFPVTSETGQTYRFLDLVHRFPHTWYGDLLHFAFPQLPVAIAVGGLTTFLLVAIFTRPVVNLRKAARELAHGHLNARVKESQGSLLNGDEFDALVHDFNHMAERLESLVNAQKLLLRDVSHELRSPLARASVALELSRDDADPTMMSHLDRIQRETERLNQLIGQLLTLSSMEAKEGEAGFERIVLNDVIREIVSDANYEAVQRHCSVAFEPREELYVMGRRELIYRAIENIVRNAIRFTAEGTTVEIETDSIKDGIRNMSVVQVSDHGPGIPEQEIGSIFRPFYRVDPARSAQTGGFGVGLAIADRAIRLHKGEVRAFNRNSGGLTIELRLPRA
jgi:two-component system sensor histidine kinase CpxA